MAFAMGKRKWKAAALVVFLVFGTLVCMGTGKREKGVSFTPCQVSYSEKKDGDETVLAIGNLPSGFRQGGRRKNAEKALPPNTFCWIPIPGVRMGKWKSIKRAMSMRL